MVWQRRARPAWQAEADAPPPLTTRVTEFRTALSAMSGRLPVRAVVLAHQIGDLVGAAIGGDDQPDLDPRTAVRLEKVLTDYVPNSLRGYLAVRDHGGAEAEGELYRQLALVREEARRIAREAVARETDSLRIHGFFLDTKMTGSDLEV